MAHRCPNRCHRCPLMNGDVMPGCMGTAALATNPRDMSHCTCALHSNDDMESLRARVKKLEGKILQMSTTAPPAR